MIRKILLILIVLAPLCAHGAAAPLPDSNLVLLKNDSPLIAFRILFRAGSASDPAGKEGVAQLTASMISQGGTAANDYQKILQLLFPMAASYSAQVDKEMTVITGVTHRDHLMAYYALLRDAVLAPAFKQEDFDRNRTDQLNYITRVLRYNSDEELGKETLNWAIFKGQPYGHPAAGFAGSIGKLTLQDVKDFYAQQYTRANLQVGVAGNYTDELIQQIRKDFGALPAGSGAVVKLPAPPKIEGQNVVLVNKDAQSTAISFGYPVPFTRADDDYYAMMVMNTWLGQHRNQFSHLYQVIREARGLNYGDYSYIEHFPLGGQTFQPLPNVARSRQIFQVWIRPVQNANRHFVLRQALREVQMLIDKGMTKEDFELARNFVLNNTVSFALSNSEQLGYALDDRFYGLKQPFLEQVKAKLPALKLEDVNAAIRKYMSTQNVMIAAVTTDAEGYKKALLDNAPSPIHYDTPKPQAVLDEDKIIESYPLNIKAESLTVVPVDRIFE